MLNVYNHEGEFSYQIDGESMNFRGSEVFITATASVVYGREAGELEWEIDTVNLIYVTDAEGEDLKLSADEEKEIAAQIAFELLANTDIDEKVYAEHEEVMYWESRR